MDFPKDNKIHRDQPELIESNAKLLEDLAKQVDWRYVRIAYFWGFGFVLLTLFLVIFVCRLAWNIPL